MTGKILHCVSSLVLIKTRERATKLEILHTTIARLDDSSPSKIGSEKVKGMAN